jgi:serine/threonine protein kinase
MANYVVKDPDDISVEVGQPSALGPDSDKALFAEGTVINSIYRVVRCLEFGRMGVVYLCELIEEGVAPFPLVVVKMLHRAIADEGESNPTFLRFYREVDAAFRIAHPNVVSPLQFIHYDGQIGYSMEYVGGGNLAQLILADGPLQEREAIQMLELISRGVEAIHRAGVIHRDLKPENVLLTDDRRPKIADFGVAYSGSGQRLTGKGSIVGTLPYMSPEYLEKGFITRQGDIYAVGAIAYELVTGFAPFSGLGPCEMIEAKISRTPIDPREKNSSLSSAFVLVIMKALSRDLGGRFRTAAECNTAFRELLGHSSLSRSFETGAEDAENNLQQSEKIDLERDSNKTLTVDPLNEEPSDPDVRPESEPYQLAADTESTSQSPILNWTRLFMVILGTLFAFAILWLWGSRGNGRQLKGLPVIVDAAPFLEINC